MKLCTFTKENGETRVGVLANEGKVLDITGSYAAKLRHDGVAKDREIANVLVPPDMIGLIKSGDAGITAIKEALMFAGGIGNKLCAEFLFDIKNIHFNAPVVNPQKIFAVVLNTVPTLENAEKPDIIRPLYYMAPPSAITGPYDPIEIPADSGNVGSEAELAVVVGKRGKNFDADVAMDYVYGYTIHNDIPCHDISSNIEWIQPKGDVRRNYTGRSKCMDTFSPMGPYLVTADEIDIDNVMVRAWVDDVLVQQGNTCDMYHKMPDILSYCSYGHTLLPGDIISWGTVRGQIEGMTARTVDLLGRGGNLITEIEGIGKMINPIKPIPPQQR